MNGVLGRLQRLGRALMLPIAVLPIAGLLLRLGQPDVFDIPFMANAGDAIFTNLPLLFAIGVAVGLARENAGAAGLAGTVGYFILTAAATTINPDINLAVFAGLIAGLIGGFAYNKHAGTKLPDFLGFFGGRRFVPIITGFYTIILGAILGVVWPPVQNAIDAFGNWMMTSGGIGEFAYGFFNRLLIPTGLHHVLNNIAWFTFGEFQGATGDLGRFFAQDVARGIVDPSAGMFMAGFFPVMMFGLPAAALAIYFTAKKENRPLVGGMLFSVAFTSFLTGITEPIEFLFMFIAPVLYLVHALVTGVAVALSSILGIRHGFTFSAGAIDYFLNMGLATKGWWLIPMGLVAGAIYFALFVAVIRRFDLETPGREKEVAEREAADIAADRGIAETAAAYFEKLGGKDNVEYVEGCITRLRLTVKDASIIKDDELKAVGASGVVRLTDTSIQVVAGTNAELIAEEMKKLL